MTCVTAAVYTEPKTGVIHSYLCADKYTSDDYTKVSIRSKAGVLKLPDNNALLWGASGHSLSCVEAMRILSYRGRNRLGEFSSATEDEERDHLRFLRTAENAIAHPDEWVRMELVPRIRSIMEDRNWLADQDGKKVCDGFILFTLAGKIYQIDPDFSVLEVEGNYFAIGSGAFVALGAMYVKSIETQQPSIIAQIGVEAASAWALNISKETTVYSHTYDKGAKS